MSITNKSHRIMYDYTINSSSLSRVESFFDLGITFDYKLTFADHIDNLASKAYKCLGFIMQSSGCFKNIDTLKTLYLFCFREVEVGICKHRVGPFCSNSHFSSRKNPEAFSKIFGVQG